MDSPYYSLSDAASLLGVTVKTLASWLHSEAITPRKPAAGDDQRSRVVPREALDLLARKHNRDVPVGSEQETIETLSSQVRTLTEMVQRMRDTLWVNQQQGTAHATAPAATPITGAEKIVRAATELLRTLPPKPLPTTDVIFLTFQGDGDIFDVMPADVKQDWDTALADAVQNGWNMVHLIRVTSRPERMTRIVENLLQNLHMLRKLGGRYKPRYFSAPIAIAPTSEFLLVPGHGMLEMTRPYGKRYVDSAFQYGCGERLDVVYEALEDIREQWSELLLQPYQPYSAAFIAKITQVEALPADRILLMNGLSTLTLPDAIHQERDNEMECMYRADDPTRADKAHAIYAQHKRRAEIFERMAPEYWFRDVCSIQALEAYVEHGERAPDDWLRALGCKELLPHQRRAHLEHLLRMLETHEQYELGLMDTAISKGVLDGPFLLAKARGGVLLESGNPDTFEIGLESQEPNVIEGFYRYAQRIWESLPPSHKDKDWVCDQLKLCIERIPPK